MRATLARMSKAPPETPEEPQEVGPATDEELLRAWSGGDEAAGSLLYTRHARSLLRFFRTKVASQFAEDLLQETFLGLLTALDQFRGDAKFRTYLWTIARNKVWKLHQKLGKGPIEALQTSSVAIFATSASEALAREQDTSCLLDALRRLTLDQQMLLELQLWERLSLEELARATDSSVSTVNSRLRRAKAALAQELRQRGWDSSPATDELRLESWAEAMQHLGAELLK